MKTKIFNLDQIKNALDTFDPVQAIEEGFVAYSEGKVMVPPVGELLFDNPPGDAHIKYGYIKGDEYFLPPWGLIPRRRMSWIPIY
jgi:ornithine cyclodeaminase